MKYTSNGIISKVFIAKFPPVVKDGCEIRSPSPVLMTDPTTDISSADIETVPVLGGDFFENFIPIV
jgi:hypothetical protein